MRSEVILKNKMLCSTLNLSIWSRHSRLLRVVSIKRSSEYDLRRKVRSPLHPIVQLIHGYPIFISPSQNGSVKRSVRPLGFVEASDYIVIYFYLYLNTIRLVHESGIVSKFGSVDPRQAVFFAKKTPGHIW